MIHFIKNKHQLFRITTVPLSLDILLKGQLRFLNNYFKVVAVSSPNVDLERVANREGVEAKAILIRRQISPIRDLISLFKLFVLFRKENPEIVHSITPKAGLLSMLAAKMAGVPIRIHTFTGLIFPSHSGIMQKLLIKTDQLLCWAATSVYPEGQGVKQDLIKYRITSKPLKVIANGNINGIDINYFNPALFSSKIKDSLRNELQISDQDLVFVFVGRLVKDKGINELVVAFEKLQHQRIKLLLVGSTEPDLDPLLSSTTNAINSNPNIISVGFRKDVRPYLAISNLLVFPSYREGFPNVVMQAGAMGLPSIVTDINGCNEIILNGLNGIIIPPKDVNALTNALNQFIENPELIKQLSQNARESIVSRFDQQTMWNLIKEEYDKHLAEAGIV